MKILKYIFLLLVLVSCEETIKLDLPAKDSKLVIDGLLTNENEQHTVTLSRTSKYNYQYKVDEINYVGNALVIIRDDVGGIDTLLETSVGIYKTNPDAIKGEVGRSYSIEIQTKDGEVWISEPDKMLPVPKIDSMYFERDKNDLLEGNRKFYKYIVYADWQDSLNFKNNYLRNIEYNWAGQWHENISWNWVFSDKYIDGKYLEKSVLFEAYGGTNFYVKLNQYSLTDEAYKFWNLVHEQTQQTDDAIINSSISLYGNVYNANDPSEYALGYFQVSAKHSKTVYIDR